MIRRKRLRKNKPRTKPGLRLFHPRAAHQTPEQYAKEMHPPNKMDEAEIDRRVLQICTVAETAAAKIIETAILIKQLRDAVEPGQWLRRLKDYDGDDPAEITLPFTERMGQIYYAIGDHPLLTDPKRISGLPASVGAMYEITRVEKTHEKLEELAKLLDDKTISPNSTRDDVKVIIDKLKGEGEVDGPNDFNKLVNYVNGIAAFMKAWPEPPNLHPSYFKKKGKYGLEEKIDMKALELMPAWLKKLYEAHFEDDDDEDDPGHPPSEPPENPDAEPDEDPEMEELNRPRKPIPENFAAFQQRKRDEQS